jgi:inhibitor of KinA
MMDENRLAPLGDQAVFAYLKDESEALSFAAAVRRASFPWLVDVVPAYTTVAVFFDLDRIEYAGAAQRLEPFLQAGAELPANEGRLHRIPCCYELGLDGERVARFAGISGEEVIRLHAGTAYTIYAIGFCPGFPYLGYVPEVLAGVPRLDSPRLRVPPGSVGLTGRQTGIYTQERPGGWNIIGRTPLELVDVADGYFPLRTGDRVQFHRIDEGEYQRLAGQRH